MIDRKRQLEEQLSKEFNVEALEELEGMMCYREWKSSNAQADETFARDESGMQELHFERRQYLRKHPMAKHLEQLRGTDASTFWITLLSCVNNLLVAYLWSRHGIAGHPFLFMASVALVGGSLQGLMGVIIHDAGHNLVSRRALLNRWTLYLANVPMLVPVAFSFKRYHFMHHVYQGIEGKDPDLPLPVELRLIRGRWWAKALWIALFPFMYIIRGAALKKEPSPMELYNWAFMIAVDYVLYRALGWNGILYLAASMWFGYSYHPIAAHFIQEHYTFLDGQETYSYYGPLNTLFMNIGFHNEHHDLTGVPWRRLPFISALVPRMYDRLTHHVSWTRVHWDFITKEHLGPCSRVTRPASQSYTLGKEE